MALQRRAWLLLALSGALAEIGHRVTLLASTAVRGAAFPTNQWGAECDTETYNSTPCSCYGGAARRRTFLSTGRQNADTVSLDLTSYFFGNGLFFPSFQGQASGEFFAAAGYEAFGLGYRDFAAFAGANPSDPDGIAVLAAHLARIRALDPSLPLATASNIDLRGTALEAHVAPYTIVPLANNASLALISLFDRTDLMVVNPTLGARVLGFRHGLHSALAQLRRREAGMPEAVVLAIECVHRLVLQYDEDSAGSKPNPNRNPNPGPNS